MKINTRNLPYEEVLKLPRLEHRTPRMPSRLLAGVVRIGSAPTLWKTKFHYTTERMELVGDEPCLILMNPSGGSSGGSSGGGSSGGGSGGGGGGSW